MSASPPSTDTASQPTGEANASILEVVNVLQQSVAGVQDSFSHVYSVRGIRNTQRVGSLTLMITIVFTMLNFVSASHPDTKVASRKDISQGARLTVTITNTGPFPIPNITFSLKFKQRGEAQYIIIALNDEATKPMTLMPQQTMVDMIEVVPEQLCQINCFWKRTNVQQATGVYLVDQMLVQSPSSESADAFVNITMDVERIRPCDGVNEHTTFAFATALNTNPTADTSIYGKVEEITANGHEAICKLTWIKNEADDSMRLLADKLVEEFNLLAR
ncbi:hypothetical protein BDF22DRAFT_677992 [Syncephalis plumigaleata]|nr:hypothetical protein BDF22DRAFT_677992 [Syncephalis plumigaleata]